MVRHAAHSQLGSTLSGRSNVSLSEAGREQAARLGSALTGSGFAAVFSSPLQRTRETANALLEKENGSTLEVAEPLNEVDFGRFKGRGFDELQTDPAWRRWNEERGEARAPEGECMLEVQNRVVSFMETTASLFAGRRIAMVSHCDVIRAALARFLGLPLAKILNFAVDPASVSRVAVGDWGGQVLSINEVRI